MLMIISPAKTQSFSSDYNIKCTKPKFLDRADLLVKELQKLSSKEISKLMKISTKLAELNFERFKNYNSKYAETCPAIFAYRGDVYQGFELDKYKKADFDFAQKHLRILTGLYGVLRPLDLIQAYRLEMSTKLKTNACDDLYEYWKGTITKSLNSELQGSFLINLASNEYSDSINLSELKADILTCTFKEKKGDKYKIVGLLAKRARGMMANWIIRNKIENKADLKKFSESKYCFSKSYSSEDNYVFIRG